MAAKHPEEGSNADERRLIYTAIKRHFNNASVVRTFPVWTIELSSSEEVFQWFQAQGLTMTQQLKQFRPTVTGCHNWNDILVSLRNTATRILF